MSTLRPLGRGQCTFARVLRDQLEARLESPLPVSLTAGSATAVYCSGTASLAGAPVEGLELVVDGAARRPAAARMPRFDMPCRRSGFWAVVPVRAPSGGGTIELAARAAGGVAEVALGRIAVGACAASAPAGRGDGLIAICMATFDPDPELLRAQLESIRAQTDRRWTCVISDDCSSPERYGDLRSLVEGDPRFTLSRSEERIGFYRNFERALTLAPPDAELIALCDQDDVWRPDKLAVLRAAIGTAALAYSDQRLVDRQGHVLRETLWRGRSNNRTNLASMLVANTVTGAAALLRREVVQRALPFPDSPGIEFHDHWIALVALAGGEIAYVEEPLYDYVQHEAAILGKVAGEHGRRRGRIVRAPRMREWRAAYFLGYVPGQVRAQTLLLRCGDSLTGGKRRALVRYLAVERSPVSFAWFVLRPLRALFGRNETLGGEWELARGVVWRWLAGLVARFRWWPERWLLDTRLPGEQLFEHRRLRRWRADMRRPASPGT